MKEYFSIGDLKALVMESKSEFEPKLGDGVESEDKKNNKEAYKNAEKRSGAKEVKVKHDMDRSADGNKTMTDLELDAEPSADWKKKVHAQAEGYTSVAEKNNGEEKIGEFGDDFYKANAKAGKEKSKNKKDFKQSGLRGKELPENWFEKESMYEHKIKTVRFKKTSFLTEEHMISKIPDEMKFEGNIFKMTDKNENTYIVEWKKDEYKNVEDAVILEHTDNRKINESLERMKSLYNFKHSTQYAKTTGQDRLNESGCGFTSTLENIRKYN